MKYGIFSHYQCDYSKPKTFVVTTLKFEPGDFRVMCPKYADGMANSADPDRTAPLGENSAGPDQTATLGENSADPDQTAPLHFCTELSVRKLRTFTVSLN